MNIGAGGMVGGSGGILGAGGKSVVVIDGGYFRLAGDKCPRGLAPAFDTGWMKNEITIEGLASILCRFAKDDQSGIDGSKPANIATPPDVILLGTGGTGPLQSYWGETALISPLGNQVAIDSWVYAGGGETITDATRLVFSASFAAGDFCSGLLLTADAKEIALLNGDDVMLAASGFSAVTISQYQAFTAFYSIGLSQAELA